MEVILSHYSKDLALDAFNHYILGNVKSTYDAHSALLHYVSAVREYACSLCFHFNLERAARKAEELGLDEFTTTLTVSRFKNSKKIFAEGDSFKGFKEFDFKKKDGFNRSIILSKELGLYRQTWCGCEFSKGDRNAT